MDIPKNAERELAIKRVKEQTDWLNTERNKPGVSQEQYLAIGEDIGWLAETVAHDWLWDEPDIQSTGNGTEAHR
jgi:hypothetical protein